MINKKVIFVLLFPLLLSGCFMYQNFICSINGTCSDVANEEIEALVRENGLNEKAEILIAERCLKTYGYKKGTMEYMHCQDLSGGGYRIDRKYDGVELAYHKLRNTFVTQEETCKEYGFKPKTKNYLTCLKELEEKNVSLEAVKASAEAQKTRNNLSCTANTAFGSTFISCY